MAKGFLRWASGAFAEEALVNGVGSLFRGASLAMKWLVNNKTVQEKAGEAIGNISNHFLKSDHEIDQLYYAACKTEPMTPALFKTLEERQSKFKGKDRIKMIRRFRTFVAQSKFEGNKETEDIRSTAEVLHLLASSDEETWKHSVNNLGLKKPLEAKTVLVLIKKKGKALEQAIEAQRTKFGTWANNNLPTARAHSRLARKKLNRYKRTQEQTEPVRQTHWWSLR